MTNNYAFTTYTKERRGTLGPLVYLVTLKCASRFFTTVLSRSGWTCHGVQTVKDIDWDTSIVFGHIRDPIERRHRAILQYLRYLKLEEQYLHDSRLQHLLAVATRLDRHGYTYHDMYGDMAWKVDWIPMWHGHNKTVSLTEKFLLRHRAEIPQWIGPANETTSRSDKKIVDLLKQHWSSRIVPGPNFEYTSQIYAQDQELCNAVVKRFDHNADDWIHASWLR